MIQEKIIEAMSYGVKKKKTQAQNVMMAVETKDQ